MALLSVVVLLGACALREVLPGPPVAVGKARAAYDAPSPPRSEGGAPIVYTGPASDLPPILHFQVWGLRYALDVVLVSDDPHWVMHEYARVDLPSGPLWLAKDAGADREQTIVADLPDLESWVPEVPVRRLSRPLRVSDRSTATHADLGFAYENALGEPVEVTYRGVLPTEPSRPRNGNTMGHSRASVAALLDLYRFRIGGDVQIRIGGVARGLHRLAGLVPEAYLLAQVQAGFAITDFCQSASSGGFTLRRPCADGGWPTRSNEAWTVAADGWVERPGDPTRLRYHFVEGELDRAEVLQEGAPDPLLNLTFTPRLPDLRRPFAGEAYSSFVADVNGQPGHGIGCVRVALGGPSLGTFPQAVRIEITPSAPSWFADRPLAGEVVRALDVASVRTWRADPDAVRACGPSP